MNKPETSSPPLVVGLDRKVSLLPCPFCGSDATLAEREQEYRFVMCDGCGACISNTDSMPENDCVEIWNKRANVKLRGE